MNQANPCSQSALKLPDGARLSDFLGGLNNVQAIAEVVIKELRRRKDFYVLFILTALITLVLGSVNFFNEDKIVRYLKEISFS